MVASRLLAQECPLFEAEKAHPPAVVNIPLPYFHWPGEAHDFFRHLWLCIVAGAKMTQSCAHHGQ
jgi:hypothetical protein